MFYLTCVSGVVKRIIPAVASTNAVIAGMLPLQVFSGLMMLESVLIFFKKLSSVTGNTASSFLSHFSCLRH